MKHVITIILLIVFLSVNAQAQEESYWDALFTAKKTAANYAPKSDSFLDKLKHKILLVKDKAIDYYEAYTQKTENAQVAKESTVENGRTVASDISPVVITDDLPNYKTVGLEEKTKEIEGIKEKLKQTRLTNTIEGRAADASLKKSKSGVAVFDIYESSKKGQKASQIKVKNIPELNIGVESQVSSQALEFQMPTNAIYSFEKIRELKSPSVFSDSDLKSFYTMSFEKTSPLFKFEEIVLALPKDITVSSVKLIALVIAQDIPVQELPFQVVTVEEIRFLKGIILAEYKDKCHMSAGLLKNSVQLKDNEKVLRDYFYSTCLYKMGFYTEAVPELLKISEQNIKTYSKNAISLILNDLKREYVAQAGVSLEKIPLESINEADRDFYHYYKGFARSMRKDNAGALVEAMKVDVKSDKYLEAQYLASVSEYLLGKVTESIARQEKLLLDFDKRGAKGVVKSLVKMNQGRAAYRNKQYKKAIEAYQFIGKENPLWIQALTEQGWMQILAGDAPGAVGNMHSIQIPQFKDIYKPESYAVRAIGYLNICQYGDADKTLQHLTKIYSPWISSFKEELKKGQQNYVFYNNVLLALKGGENKTTLPQPVIREVTRHKDFLNIQEAINNKVDEEAQFGFISGLIKKDEANARSKKIAAESRAKALQVKVVSATKVAENQKFLNQWKTEREFELSTSIYYDFEIETAKESSEGFRVLEKIARKDILEKKDDYKSLAGKTMKSRLASMQKKLEKLIENNEFLTYEVLSGSGESIRYVSAGGQTKGTASTRELAAKENKGKMYLWDFDGEYWADEIGNYKSSLKDNCARAGNYTQKVD